MKRGSLFFIGLLSAIVTIVSLNVAFGSSSFYNQRYAHFGRYHHCGERYNNRYDDRHNRNYNNNDSSTRNY